MVINDSGRVVESNQYKAFGVKDYSFKERPQATGYIGKEKDTEMNLADHGVRKYDSDLGRFLCPDAMWEKYISYTPYHYSLNNPISNIDWDGKVVKAMDEASRANIVNSVESQYRSLIAFKDNGTAYLEEKPKIAPMMKDLSNFTNIGALQVLINSKEIIEVSQNNNVNYVDNGNYKSLNIDLYLKGNGIALIKKSSNEIVTSTKNNHEAIISPNQFKQLTGKATKGSTAAHELYGHIFLYIWGLKGYGTPQYNGHQGKTGEHIIEAEKNAKKD